MVGCKTKTSRRGKISALCNCLMFKDNKICMYIFIPLVFVFGLILHRSLLLSQCPHGVCLLRYPKALQYTHKLKT